MIPPRSSPTPTTLTAHVSGTTSVSELLSNLHTVYRTKKRSADTLTPFTFFLCFSLKSLLIQIVIVRMKYLKYDK